MTALWTINLRVAGTANVPLFSQKTIFKNDTLDKLLPSGFSAYSTLLIILIIALIVKIILDSLHEYQVRIPAPRSRRLR